MSSRTFGIRFDMELKVEGSHSNATAGRHRIQEPFDDPTEFILGRQKRWLLNIGTLLLEDWLPSMKKRLPYLIRHASVPEPSKRTLFRMRVSAHSALRKTGSTTR